MGRSWEKISWCLFESSLLPNIVSSCWSYKVALRNHKMPGSGIDFGPERCPILSDASRQ